MDPKALLQFVLADRILNTHGGAPRDSWAEAGRIIGERGDELNLEELFATATDQLAQQHV